MHVPSHFEPVTFTTVIDPAEAPAPPLVSVSPEDDRSVVGELESSVAEKEVVAGGTVEPEEAPELDLPEPIDSAEVSETQGNPSQSGPLSSPSEHDSLPASELPSPEPEPELRRSAHSRKPPDRLQDSEPGRPLLKSIQSLLHGLSSVFTFALQEDEPVVPTVPSPPAISCQPGPCTRMYMRSRGEKM